MSLMAVYDSPNVGSSLTTGQGIRTLWPRRNGRCASVDISYRPAVCYAGDTQSRILYNILASKFCASFLYKKLTNHKKAMANNANNKTTNHL